MPLRLSVPHDTPRKDLEVYARLHAQIRPRDETDRGWRDGMRFTFDTCPHTTCRLIEIETELGVWGMEICERCGEQVQRECAHSKSVWLADGTVLLCPNCGSDGT